MPVLEKIRKKDKKSILLNAAISGIFAASAASMLLSSPANAESKDSNKKVHCYGVNKCKGTGACGGKDHQCAGQNKCKGQGWLKIDKETCLKIQGGRLTPNAK